MVYRVDKQNILPCENGEASSVLAASMTGITQNAQINSLAPFFCMKVVFPSMIMRSYCFSPSLLAMQYRSTVTALDRHSSSTEDSFSSKVFYVTV